MVGGLGEINKRPLSKGPAARTRAKNQAKRQRNIEEYFQSPAAAVNDISSPNTSTTPHKIQLPEENLFHSLADVLTPRKNVPARRPQKTGKRTVSEDSEGHENVSSRANLNHKLTEYFPVRRSVRRTKKCVLEEKQRSLESSVLSGIEDGLKVVVYPGKGRGVSTTRPFARGEFVVEYCGDLIDTSEARLREESYAQNEATGCYMYYFKHLNQAYCIDATAETKRLGRLVNHSRNGNLMPKVVFAKDVPHLVLLAKTDIASGVEVCYDYGDRSKESLRHHPWLAS